MKRNTHWPLILTFLLILCFGPSLNAKKYELSACAIFQDDARFLKEWIEYHRIVGVEHFWLYNNESKDNYMAVLQPYIDAGIVELTEWPNQWPNESFFFFCQANAYRDALSKARGKTKWLAIIDTDEFLLPMAHKTVTKCLRSLYSNCPAVGAYWICFGTSGIGLLNPNQTMISQLLWRAEENYSHNKEYKSIVKPEMVADFPNPHCGILSRGTLTHCPRNILRINHYWSRDEAFVYEVKVPRYNSWGVPPDECIREANALNQEMDVEILKYNDELSQRLGFTN